MKIRLRDIQLNQLNNNSLKLVAQYARLMRVDTGVRLKLHDRDILMKISDHARNTENDELIALYQELKKEVRVGVFESMKAQP